MANGVDLLRLLEPAVRPGGGLSSSAMPRQPIESRSFDSILEEARAMPAAVDPDVNAMSGAVPEGLTASASGNPLASLSRVDLIDNAALLRLIGGSQSPMPAATTDV